MTDENPVTTGNSVDEAVTEARKALEEYDYWGARHTRLYLATKALIEAVEGVPNG